MWHLAASTTADLAPCWSQQEAELATFLQDYADKPN